MTDQEIIQVGSQTYTIGPTARSVHRSPARVKAVMGPVGSGKTTIGCFEFFLLCRAATTNIRGCVIRESYRELKDSTVQTFMSWFGEIADYRYKDELAILTIPGPDGIMRQHEMLFRACRRVSEVSKFLSTEFAMVWLEEPVPAYSHVGVMGCGLDRDIYEFAVMRGLRQKGAPWHEILLTFNPPTTHHWVYQEFFLPAPEELQRKNYAVWRMSKEENEPNLPTGYYDMLLRILSPDLARRFVGNEIITLYPGERVYGEIKDGWHIREDVAYDPNSPLVLGFDFGNTPACLITQVVYDPVYGTQWRWLNEVQLWNAALTDLVSYLQIHLKELGYSTDNIRCWADPQPLNRGSEIDNRTPRSILEAAGFPVEGGVQEWFARRETMKAQLRRAFGDQPAVVISRSGCPLAVEGLLGGYRFPKSLDGRLADKPLKNEFSHIIECGEYIGTREFSVLLSGQPTFQNTTPETKSRPWGWWWNPLKRAPQEAKSWLMR